MVAEVEMPDTPILGWVAPIFVETMSLIFDWPETVSRPVRGGKANASTTAVPT